MTLHTIHVTIVDLRIKAFEKGGDTLLDKVTVELGVAIRHKHFIAEGSISLTPGVEQAIKCCFDRVEKLINETNPTRTHG